MILLNKQSFLTVAAFLFLCLTSVSQTLAQEQIKNFHSKVEVAENGALTVTETITVNAEGRDIKRGIYRDFPLLFKNEAGKLQKVTFNLLSTLRDGVKDRNKVEYNSQYVRIYIGKSDFFLPHGTYTYTIKYETDRQMRFFEEHDVLFWNVTGNFWRFPILQASAEFHFPENTQIIEKLGFTGPQGSRDENLNITVHSHPTIVRAKATIPLGVREGMSVAMKMPTGTFTITDAQEFAWYWSENKTEILSLISLVIVSLYYFISWIRVGRDPEGGVVVPRWKAPDGVSPALVDYIDKKGLSGHGFSALTAALLSLGVKGLVQLEKKNDDLQIISTQEKPRGQLPTGEQAVYNSVKWGSNGGTFAVSDNNSIAVKDMQTKFASAMELEHRNKYYAFNWLYIVGGVLLSILAIFISVPWDGGNGEIHIGALIPIGVTTAIIGFIAMNAIKGFALKRSSSMFSKIVNLTIAGVVLGVVIYNLMGLVSKNFITDLFDSTPVIMIVSVIMLNILFFFLLGAPTSLGRKRMDEIEGLKTYLSLAEKDRMNMIDVPDFSTQHYEELLPYAVALGVEKPWTNSLNVFLASSLAAGAAASYAPDWYPSYGMGRGSRNTFDDLSNSIESGFADSMPVPKSSDSGFSSGGGGFSGGGGGGGGGGGW